MFTRIFPSLLFLLWAFAPVLALATPVSEAELEQEVTQHRLDIPEFRKLAAEAKKRGLRLFVLGGGAASVADHAKAGLLAAQGHLQSGPARLAWDFNNVVLPEQDVDLVITKANGKPETVAEINDFRDWVRQEYPYEFDGRSRWDVLGLQTSDPQGHKMALKGNPDFLNQNNDSLSLGLLELTDPPAGQSVISDLAHPGAFLRDTAGDELHFYRNPLHASTTYFRQGRNPEILSVVRTLEKATRYEKSVDSAGVKAIRNIIRNWDPQGTQPGDYVHTYLSGRGKRMISHARNIHQAMDLVEMTGLRDKMTSLPLADESQADNIAWWMHKKPLPKDAAGAKAAGLFPTGRTAADLGITEATHWTSFPVHRLLTWNYDGTPRLFESRDGYPGEGAVLGDGFYTYKNSGSSTTYPPRIQEAMVTFSVNPNAREGVDFTLDSTAGNVVVWKNSSALTVKHKAIDYPDKMSCNEFYSALGGTTPGFSRPANRLNYAGPANNFQAPGTINNPGAVAGMHIRHQASSAQQALTQVLPTYNLAPAVKADFDALLTVSALRKQPITLEELSAVAAKHFGSGLDFHTTKLLSNMVRSDTKLMDRVARETKLLTRLGQQQWAQQIEANPFLIFDAGNQRHFSSAKAKRLMLVDNMKADWKNFSDKHPFGAIAAQTTMIAGTVSGAGAYVGQKMKEAKDQDLDGILNEIDRCPGTPANTPVNLLGCAVGQGFDYRLKGEASAQEAELGNFLRAFPELRLELRGTAAQKTKRALEKTYGIDAKRIEAQKAGGAAEQADTGQPVSARFLR